MPMDSNMQPLLLLEQQSCNVSTLPDDQTILRDSTLELDTTDELDTGSDNKSNKMSPFGKLIDNETNFTILRGDFSDESTSTKDAPRQTKERIFRCRHCTFAFNNKVEFWKHARHHIKPEKLLECKQCEFVTEYRHHMEYHVRNHLNSKPYSCDRCPYRCVNRSMLNSHMKSHTNVCQYRCRDCNYATKYCHSLKTHLRKNNHRPAIGLNLDLDKLPVSDSTTPSMKPDSMPYFGSTETSMSTPIGKVCPDNLPDFDQYLAPLRNYLQSSLLQHSMSTMPRPRHYLGSPIYPPAMPYLPTPPLLYPYNLSSPTSWFPFHMANADCSPSSSVTSPDNTTTNVPTSDEDLLDLRIQSKRDEADSTKIKGCRLDSICKKLNNSIAQPDNDETQQECPHCEIIFKESSMFRRHMSYHSDYNPLKCSGCGSNFHNKLDFHTHFQTTAHS